MMTTTPMISDFVLYAERSLSLGDHDKVLQGDIGVHSIAESNSGIQLKIGTDSVIESNHHVFSPSVSLGHDVKVGIVQTNMLQDNGIHLGSLVAFPASVMPPLPLAPTPAISGSSVTVGANEVVALLPGNYDALIVLGTLVLNPGRYFFSSATLIDYAQFVAVAGDVHISIRDYLTAGRHVKIYTAFREGADQLTISVSGSDKAGGPPAVSLGEHSTIRALLTAPHGSISLADHVHATGAFAGFDIALGEDVHVDFECGFPVDAPNQQGSQQLQGYYGVHPDPSVAPLAGPVPADANIALHIGLPVRDSDGLKTFIKQVSDPKSPTFRKHLTQTQFCATYGATNSDYHGLQDWATFNGFTIYATYPNNLLLSVSGTAAQIEQALFVNLVYRLRNDGSKFVAVDREPSLNLTVPILEISGLSDFRLPQPSNGTGGTNGNLYLAADIRNAYLGVDPYLQSLDGTGQVIGLFELNSFSPTDIIGYDNVLNPNLNLNPANVRIAGIAAPPWFTGYQNDPEVALDIEMVQAMAPGAQVLVFQGATGITNWGDSILHSMANYKTPALTCASCSWSFGRNGSAQQALDQMAAQGVSFFSASGDYGDIGDPQSNLNMDSQTLVGGTFLATSALGTPPVYPSNYYVGETTWNQQPPSQGKGVTGGGIMDGNNKIGGDIIGISNPGCYCWPYPLCCGSGVAIPDYQVGIMQTSAAVNGGSTQWRNYPDVAMLAGNIEIFFNGATIGRAGTSAAAPLWAGFMALVNQAIWKNDPNAGLAGFVNQTLYDIGETRGGDVDLYSACFNDIQDGVSNYDGFGSGFKSVPGYDLTTGLGTPKPEFIYQVSSPTPLTPNLPMSNIRFVVGTGNDDLRGNGGFGSGCKGSGATADIFLSGGGSFTVTLQEKDTYDGMPNWSTNTFDFAIPAKDNDHNLITPLTPTHGIVGVRINMQEGDYSFPCTADNWDIASLSVSLYRAPAPPNSLVCQLNLVGTSVLPDGSIGLVRLIDSTEGLSSPIYMTGSDSGCP